MLHVLLKHLLLFYLKCMLHILLKYLLLLYLKKFIITNNLVQPQLRKNCCNLVKQFDITMTSKSKFYYIVYDITIYKEKENGNKGNFSYFTVLYHIYFSISLL